MEMMSNSIILYGDNTKIKAMKKILEGFVSIFQSSKRELQLERLAKVLGMDVSGIAHGGYIEEIGDIEGDGTMVRLNVETCWQPLDEFWDLFCRNHDLKYASLTDGPDCHWIHGDLEETFFPENYKLDVYEDNAYGLKNDVYYFETKEELQEWLDAHATQPTTPEFFSDCDFAELIKFERD